MSDAFRHAVYADDFDEIAELLLRGEDPKQVLFNGSTALHEATTYDLANLLLKQGASLAAMDDYGRTPLHQLAYADEPVAMGQLFARWGADLEAIDVDGRTPLLTALAADQADPQAATVLLDLGADPQAVDRAGNNTLHCWAQGRAIAQQGLRLIGAGIDPCAKNKDGLTPRHLLENVSRGSMVAHMLEVYSAFDRALLGQQTPRATANGAVRRI